MNKVSSTDKPNYVLLIVGGLSLIALITIYISQKSNSTTNDIKSAQSNASGIEKARFIYGIDSMNNFISANIVIPEPDLNAKKSVVIIVSFVVEKDGSISTIERSPDSTSVDPKLVKSAFDVVAKMSGMWRPAMKNGKPVRMRYSLPISFNYHSNILYEVLRYLHIL